MFTCPHCNQEAKTLIMTGLGYVGCYNCSNTGHSTLGGANYHQRAGLKGVAKVVTEIEKKHIWQRTTSEDGSHIVDKSTGKKWSW